MNIDRRDPEWLALALEGLRVDGYAVVDAVLDEALLTETREALYRVQELIHRDVGPDRLARAGELGVLRLMPRYDAHFLRFLGVPELLAVVDATVSDTAILHLQNGFVLPSLPPGESADVFQRTFHMDFRRVLNGYVMSINVMFAIDEFSAENGGTLVVPGTHQRASAPSERFMRDNAAAVDCPPGSMIVFDSTLWHAAGENLSGRDRLAINHQFTRSYVKQQIDYVRALGEEVVASLGPRTQQILGWYTRVVTDLDEYYVPSEERLYRSGQG